MKDYLITKFGPLPSLPLTNLTEMAVRRAGKNKLPRGFRIADSTVSPLSAL